MGFTVVGPDRFLGSGHPDARDDLPPHLGLIASDDAGRTWRPVSLLGRADFHVLRASGRYVYGFDVTNDRLLVSRNGGREWSERAVPAPVVDLAIHPANPTRAVAATYLGLFLTTDEGRTWKLLTPRAGLVAWPAPDLLYVVTLAGEVFARRAPNPWRRVGSARGEVAAFLAANARELYIAFHDGTIKVSSDGGRTWRVRVAS